MVYKQLRININEAQLNKALAGKPFSLKANQIGSGDSFLSLHPANAKLIEKSALKGRGCILDLSEGELLSTSEDMAGQGIFKDIWKKLKSGYKWTKKNIIDTPEYQKVVKPLVRGVIDTAAAAAATALPGSASIINAGVSELGKKTGAFGAKGRKKTTAQRRELLSAKGLYLS